jgi:hypothetical protein
MWKEAAVAKFKVLYRYLPGGTEKNHEKLGQDSQTPGRDLKPGPPEYETAVLTVRHRRSVEPHETRAYVVGKMQSYRLFKLVGFRMLYIR